MVKSPGAISPELAAAQAQLVARREQRRQQRVEHGLSAEPAARDPLPDSGNAHARHKPSGSPVDSSLGWGSVPLTQALATASRRRQQQQARRDARTLSWLAGASSPPAPPGERAKSPASERSDRLRLYPDLALAMLRQQEVATGRIWFLLRHLDFEGRGWVTVAEARAQLTEKQSALRVCGWRQLRNLLAEGEGRFWTRDPHTAEAPRIWLRSLHRVAAAFGVRRLSLRPVLLPITLLSETIGTVRAHFYASFHSGRVQQRPVARETLADISSVSRRTQQHYEKKAGVKRDKNWVIGPRHTPQAAREQAWQRGQALFTFTDETGTYGQPGHCYLAWQLPNSYTGPHAPLSRGHQKQINQKLADLFMKGITGNGGPEVEQRPALQDRRLPARFYAHGEEAVRASKQVPDTEHYWQTHRRQRQVRIWHVLPARGKAR